MKNDIIALTKKLIAIPSDVNNREACLEALKTAQQELEGFSFTSFAKDGIPSLLYTNTPTPTKKCKIIFNAHLDVVPGSVEQFKPFEKDGKLYGRGAFDMKAATAVTIFLFKELANKLPYTLGLQLTTDEEIVGFKGVRHQLDQGVTAEFAITGECGSNLNIINKLRGLYVIKLHASGKSAHAGHLWHGENALLKLHEVINTILIHYPTPNKPSWQTSINLAQIKTGNETHNKVPADATALLDIRYVSQDAETILPKIQSFLPESITMEVIKKTSPLDTEKTNSYIQQLGQAFKNVTKKEVTIVESYGGSDIIFYPQFGIKGIEFGPIGHGQHANEEWVDIEGLENYYEILKAFLLSIKE